MKFEVIISQLLLKHDCVIVPQLGGFVTFYKSAVIHPINHSIQPPSKQLGFNRHLTANDGLLLNNFVKSTGETLQNAQAQLDQWTKQIQNQLANGQKSHLNGIGTLWSDAQGQIQFIPSEKFVADFTAFGLANIQLTANKQTPTGVVQTTGSWKKIAAAASIAVLLASGLFVFNNHSTQTDTAGWNPGLTAPSEQKSNRSSVPNIVNPIPGNNFQQEFIDLWNAEPIVVNKIAVQKSERVEKERNQNQTIVSKITNVDTKQNHSEWGKSWVVGGVFKSKSNAQDQVNTMKGQGFSNAKVIPFQDFFYAVYGTTNNEKDEAKLRAKVLTVDPRAWTKR